MKRKYRTLTYSVIILFAFAAMAVSFNSRATNDLALEKTPQSWEMSQEEKAELLRMIPHVIAWMVDWYSGDKAPCPEGENIALKNQLEKAPNKQVMATIEASRSKIFVTMDALHHRFVFGRTQGKGLYLQTHNRYCTSSYAEHVKKYEDSSKIAIQTMKATLDKLSALGIKVPSESEEDKVILYREDVLFDVSSLLPDKQRHAERKSEWDIAKKSLYNKFLNAVSLDSRVTCEKGLEIELSIPDFEIDDPGIYLLLIERPGYSNASGRSIVYLGFRKNDSNTGHEISEIKLIGLEDEVNYFAKKIKEKSPRAEKIICGRSRV